jgi:DNA-binding transcriptional MocR family regulator
MTAVASVEGAPLARMVREAPRPDGANLPAYRVLAHAVRTLILDGRICPSTRVPAERELATALGMSRTTVTAAYDLLRREAFLESRPGSGTWTALPAAAAAASWPARSAAAPIDLSRPILGPAAGFPAQDPARVLAEAAPAIAAHLSDPGRHRAGLPDLRAAVAEQYTRRGLPTTPDQIVVTGGSRAGLALAIGLLCGPGDRVLVENPTHPEAIEVLRSCAVRPVPVPVGYDGITPAALTATFLHAAPRLAHLGAGYQSPTGILPSAEVRLTAADAARRAGTWLVADETAIEPVLDGDVPEPFALGVPAAAAGQIITVGAPAQTHGAGLRVGWIRTTAHTAAALARRQAGTGQGVSVLDQILAVDLLRRGEAVVAERRAVLRERRAALEAALTRFVPQWSWRRPAGGLTLWVDLGRPSAAALARRAADAGVRITDGSCFGVDPGTFDQRVPLPYTLPPEVLAEAVRRLAAVWCQGDCPLPPPDRPVWIV